ncbi:MAG TPA: response regulator transcription factor [Candidatus Acidoferrum sp.]|jgi:DNA-binding NarL/FixJ family response regulator
MGNLRLLVADDHEIVRRGLRSIFEEQPGWEIAGEATNGREAVLKAKHLKPDVTVLDLGMPSLNGLEATRQLLRENQNAKVLILASHASDPLVRQALKAGARGCVAKSSLSGELVAAVNAVGQNKPYCSPAFASNLNNSDKTAHRRSQDGIPQQLPQQLTARQREVVQLLAEGETSKNVGVLLGISSKTAETHRANIMRRLDCHSVSDLVRYAVRNKMIEA